MPGADRRRHRLLDQPHFACAGVGGGVADRAALDAGRARRHAHHHLGLAAEAAAAADRLGHEMLDHLLGDLEVGDHPVAQRADGAEVGRRLAEHQLGIVADRADLGQAIAIFERDHRRLLDDDAAIAQVDDGVGGAEVDRQIARAEIEKRKIHWPPPGENLGRQRVIWQAGEAVEFGSPQRRMRLDDNAN